MIVIILYPIRYANNHFLNTLEGIFNASGIYFAKSIIIFSCPCGLTCAASKFMIAKIHSQSFVSLVYSMSLTFERFYLESLWARCASHSKDLSNNFVWEMMVHSSLYLRVPVGYWNNGRCNGIGTRLLYAYTCIRFHFVRHFNAFCPSIRDQLRFIRIFGWCLCQPWRQKNLYFQSWLHMQSVCCY